MTNPFIQPLVFISHASDEDADVAKSFEDWIKLAYKSNVKTFVSSTVGIPPNTAPAKAIQDNLKTTTLLIALLSPVAHDHNWIASEISETRGRNKPVYPILCKGATADNVPSSILAMHEILDAHNIDQFFSVIEGLDENLKIRHCHEYETLRHTLCNDYEKTPTPNSRHEKTFKLILKTNIHVNTLNNSPLCPWCEKKKEESYLCYSEYKDFNGETWTKFSCNRQGCGFEYNLQHEKPWQEMLVDL